MDSEKVKHYEFVQNIITRMNTNSFQIKTVTIALVSQFILIYGLTKKVEFFYIALIPCVLFWFLDSYYLQQERKWRGLYEDIIVENKENQTKIQLFAMSLSKYQGGEYCRLKALFSETMLLFYPIIIILLLLTYWIIKL